MARSNNDVSRVVCVNTIQENEKRLQQARIKSQGKDQTRQVLDKLFRKLNQTVEGNSMKSADKLNLCYNRHVTRYGPISGFPPGSWWGIRMDCSRDHVHDPFDADVDAGPFGVASVCISHTNMNEDVDLGDFLTITGQMYNEEHPNLDSLIYNYKSQIPLRLIRSYKLQDHIAPKTGYRYDGLYVVISYWISKNVDGTSYNKFALKRLIAQELPSWNNETSETLPSIQHPVLPAKSNHSKPYISSNAYDLRKCSNNTDGICSKRKFNHKDNCEIVKITPSIDIRKSVPESSILTRHVFKKPSNAESTTCSTSVPERKTLTCLGTSVTKTHSTNISIRSGLYESPHNAQETRKNVTTMLHKPFKPIDITNRTALDIDARLSQKEDSKLIARIDTDIARSNSRATDNASCNGHVVVNDTMDKLVYPLSKRQKVMYSHVVYPNSSKHSHVTSTTIGDSDNDTKTIECKEHHQNIHLQSAKISTQMSNRDNELQRNSVTTHERIPKCYDTAEMLGDSLYAQNIKSLKSFDSLTPDKILNLINKEKHHPLSKLLIGNVIGLTSEECAMWDAKSKVATPDASPKISHKQRDNVKENVACLSEDMLNRRYYKYSKSKRLSWKKAKQSDIGKFDKATLSPQSRNNADKNCNSNATMKNQCEISKENNEYLSTFHVQTPLQNIAQHTRSAYDIKTRLRADKDMLLTKQEFPSSPIKKNRYKKQDREIANLSIDANIGPKTRGPRNRRLRCINNTYTSKRCYSTLNTIMYPLGKRNRIGEKKQRYKSSFKRKSKPTKVNRQSTRDRQSKSTYRVSSTLRAKNDSKDNNSPVKKEKNFEDAVNNSTNTVTSSDRNYNDSRKKESSTVTTETDDCNVPKTTFGRRLREKLEQTLPLSRRTSQTSRLPHYFHQKQVEKPSTMDATTQCRLISEESPQNILQTAVKSECSESVLLGQSANRKTIINTKYVKLGKSQSKFISNIARNDRDSQACETFLSSTSASTKDNDERVNTSGSLRKRTLAEKSLKDRTSAFVPVNTLDSDLRIARLRSIGFKPIIKPRSPLLTEQKQLTFMNTSKVIKRNVAEEYDKYTNNEDNNVVVYMDDELQYQDIEEEEEDENIKTNTSTRLSLKSIQSLDNTVLPRSLESPLESLESPWHGWKKIVTNNRSYWVGW